MNAASPATWPTHSALELRESLLDTDVPRLRKLISTAPASSYNAYTTMNQRAIRICFTLGGIFFICFLFWHFELSNHQIVSPLPIISDSANNEGAKTGATSSNQHLVLYTGPITNVFFHSLVIYPEKAAADPLNARLIQNNMITVDQFKKILQELYDDNFILYDPRLLYSIDSAGIMHRGKVYVPKGKKPLILSIDDLDYYTWMKNDGFADKLVIENGAVKTEVVTPDGSIAHTSDGDVVPIVDSFVAQHPDFSFDGMRGVIGVTGFEGILGYRTQLVGAAGDQQRQEAVQVVDALKKSGWIFASHSYRHGRDFLTGNMSTSSLATDIRLWKAQVEPLVGATNMFIGPFGRTFSDGDPRRSELLAAGFNVLYGVGTDGYMKYFGTYLVMDRIDIDGYRLAHNASFLQTHLGFWANVRRRP
jgi:hypothetical protein